MVYGKVAKKLADAGYAVTPLKGKVPVFKNWEATTPDKVVLDSKYNIGNIGLLCGKVSGVIVVDIDTFDEELEKKFLDYLPDTPVMKKGNKGINFFYQYHDSIPRRIKINNPKDRRKVEIEIISGGGQTVIPHSIHPDTKKPYYWCDKKGLKKDNHILNHKPSDLPIFTTENVEDLRKIVQEHYRGKNEQQGIVGLLDNTDKQGHRDLEDYAPKSINDIHPDYRDRCRSGSHDYMYAVMAAMVSKGRPKEEVIQEAMKKDGEYNVGYVTTYFNCHTCKYRGSSAYEKAEYLYDSAFKTMEYKKEELGEAMPQLCEVVEHEGMKEMEAVNAILKKFGIIYDFNTGKVIDKNTINVMKEGKKDIFVYDGRIWVHQKNDFFDAVYREMNHLFGYKKSNNAVKAAVEKLITYIPTIKKGQSFFTDNPYMVNFNNGTLHLLDGKLELKPHNRHNYLTNIINMDYKPDYKMNTMFMDMLERLFKGDSDKQEKIWAVQEMFGAVLMPIWPRMFFCQGVSGSGKSTIAKTITNLIGLINLSSVDPSSFDGFHMQSMINKRINMDSDIDASKPIKEGVFKKIEDRQPQRVQRKSLEDVYAQIPGVHIFMANKMPKNFDGTPGAYERRMTMIIFNNSYTEKNKNYDKNFAQKMFESNPEGILAFALEGLKRLIAKEGHYTQPRSGLETVGEWVSDNNLIKKFVEDIKINEVEGMVTNPRINEEAKTLRKEIWPIFEKWKRDCGKGHIKIGKHAFYKGIRDHFDETRIDGVFYIKGLELPTVEQAPGY